MSFAIDDFFAHVDRFSNKGFSGDQVALNFELGLVGEAGELVDLIKKSMFHGQTVTRDQWLSELGDWLWYAVAILLLELRRRNPGERDNLKKAIEQVRSILSTTYDSHDTLTQTAISISSRSVDYAKYGFYLTIPAAAEEWAKLCNLVGVTVDEVTAFNQDKLEKRHGGQRFNAQAAIASKLAEITEAAHAATTPPQQ